jgi:hypothetical protein
MLRKARRQRGARNRTASADVYLRALTCRRVDSMLDADCVGYLQQAFAAPLKDACSCRVASKDACCAAPMFFLMMPRFAPASCVSRVDGVSRYSAAPAEAFADATLMLMPCCFFGYFSFFAAMMPQPAKAITLPLPISTPMPLIICLIQICPVLSS